MGTLQEQISFLGPMGPVTVKPQRHAVITLERLLGLLPVYDLSQVDSGFQTVPMPLQRTMYAPHVGLLFHVDMTKSVLGVR